MASASPRSIAPRSVAPHSITLLAALLLLAAAPSAAPAEPACRIVRVVDGDTLRITCPETGEVRARLMGFDTPEVFSPRCPAEREAGEAATRRLAALLAEARRIRFAFEGRDRYGRALTRLWLDGRDAATLMIAAGLARPYAGGRRAGWCEAG
jgi:endonuclease YncB( thermonuclease family)